MASQNFYDVDAGIAVGSTWGTAAAVTDALHFSTITFNPTWTKHIGADALTGYFRNEAHSQKGALSVPFQATGMGTYDGAWLKLLAGFFGTTTGSPSEVNASEGDYQHTIALTAPTSSIPKFFTIAWDTESDEVIELPSVFITQISWTHQANGQLTWSITGVADKVVYSGDSTPENTAAEVAALTPPSYEECILAGTNSYVRVAAFSSSTALDSGDDQQVLSYSVSYSRAIQEQRPTRGANTPYIVRPKEVGKITGTFGFTLAEVDEGVIDPLEQWMDHDHIMAEVFFDGTIIGAGANRSHKIQLPSLRPGDGSPGGYGPQKGQLMTPQVSYEIYQSDTAAAGMSVSVPTHVIVNEESSSLF